MHIWNQLLVDHFFHEGRAGQRVRLNVTADLLGELGRPHGWDNEDFLKAAARGSAVLPKRTLNVCEYAYQLYRCWRDPIRLPREYRNAPPFVAYLGLWVYLTTLEDDDDRSFHRRLRRFFPVDGRPTSASWYPEFDRMGKLWEELERWSGQQLRGRLGTFRMLRLGKLAHLSIPRAQSILTDAERQRLPAVFATAGLTPESPLPGEKLRQVLDEFGTAHLGGRTMRAFRAGGDLVTYLFDDLRNELRRWDGTAPDEPARSDRPAITARGKVELVLFLEARGGRLTPRMRFETTLDEAADQVLYRGGFRVPDLIGAPAPGWSSPVRERTGTPFDASRLPWEDDHAWESDEPVSPRRLAFAGRGVRVFEPATRFRMGGLVEGDGLPASGWCCVAVAASRRDKLVKWLDCLPKNSYTEEKAPLPTGWTLYRLNAVPSETGLRQEFLGGSEASAPVLRLRGGLRVRRGRAGEYHTFAPPRVELGGERAGVDVRANDARLTDVGDGVFELPRNAPAGVYRIDAIHGAEFMDGVTVSLVDVVHAGSPTLVRGWADRFGHRHDGAASGWAGGWVEAEALPEFDFGLLVEPAPRANDSPQPEETGSSAAVSLDDLHWGIHPESLSPTDDPMSQAVVGNYPLRYFQDLWLLNSNRSPDLRHAAAQRIWEFHVAHGLFHPTAGLPLTRLQRLPRQSRLLGFAVRTTNNHLHTFQPSEPIPCDLDSFLGQVGADEYYLRVLATDQDRYPETEGPAYHARRSGTPTARMGPVGRRAQVLTTRGAHYHRTVYELGRLPKEPGWNVGRSRWNANQCRWDYPWCCDARGPLLVKAWTGSEVVEHLHLRDWLIAEGSTIAAPEGLNWPPDLDSYLFEQRELGAVHRNILESPPMQLSRLRITGTVAREMMLPAYADVPAAAKLAWRLAWVDRLAAWDGRSAVFATSARAGCLPPFLQALRVARTTPADSARLLTCCMAIAEYLLSILRRGGLGPAFGFLPLQ